VESAEDRLVKAVLTLTRTPSARDAIDRIADLSRELVSLTDEAQVIAITAELEATELRAIQARVVHTTGHHISIDKARAIRDEARAKRVPAFSG
jgi:hypothetical protein